MEAAERETHQEDGAAQGEEPVAGPDDGDDIAIGEERSNVLSSGGFDEYYKKWDNFQPEEEEKQDPPSYEFNMPPAGSGPGFEFRSGVKVRFPECIVSEGETEEAAAMRVGIERRFAGNDAFKDGSVWGAQQAADIWGQGCLALERNKNLRKYRKARLEGGTATEEDLHVQALEEEDDARTLEVEFEAEEAGMEEAPKHQRRVPSEAEIKHLQLLLRLNSAQAMLKLKQYEKCIQNCDGALMVDVLNKKARWRKAQAVWAIRNPGLARETLDQLLDVDPTNAAALALLQEIDTEELRKGARRRGVAAPKKSRFSFFEKGPEKEIFVKKTAAEKAFAAAEKAAAVRERSAASEKERLAAKQQDDDGDDDEEVAAPVAEAILRVMQAPLEFCCRRRAKTKIP